MLHSTPSGFQFLQLWFSSGLAALGMEGGEGIGFFVTHILLFDGSGPLVGLVVVGGGRCMEVVGEEGVVLFCLG